MNGDGEGASADPAAMLAAVREGSLHRLGEAAIGFLPRHQKLVALNPTASYIWARLAAGEEPAGCARDLRVAMAVSSRTAGDYVASFLAALEGAVASEEPDLDLHVLPAQARCDVEPVAQACYRLGERLVRVACARRADHDAIARALSHLATGEAGADHRIDVLPGEVDGRLVLDGAWGVTCGSSQGVLPALVSVLFSLWYRASADFLAVHAGLVAFRRRSVLIPGQSGSGKTTVTAALLSLGADYLSDDVVALGRGTLAASGFPAPLTVKAENVARLSALLPELTAQPEWIRADGRHLRYLAPARVARQGGAVGDDGPVDAIVFPRSCSGGAAALEPLAPADALARLASEWVRIAELDDEDVSRLAAWIAAVPAVEITYASVGDLKQVLDDYFDGG